MRPGYCEHGTRLSFRCDECSERDVAEAFTVAEARGYARAVADIIRLALNNANLHTARMAKAKSGASKRAYANSAELLLNFCQAITNGAHVGAAKKEGA